MTILDLINDLKITNEDIKNTYDFLIANDISFYDLNSNSENDFKVFSICLEIFKKTKINYFEDFKDMLWKARILNSALLTGESISSYEYSYIDLKKDAESLLTHMKFFNFEKIHGLSIDELNDLDVLMDKFFCAINKKDNLRSEKRSQEDLEYSNKYFRFLEVPTDFNIILEKQFEEKLEELKNQKLLLTKDDNLVDFSNDFSLYKDRSYLIFLYKENKVIKIFRATSSFNFERFKEYEFEKSIFVRVEKPYAESLYVKFKMHFNMILDSNDVIVTSLKYTKLNAAKKAYKYKYGLTLTDLKKIIKEKNLEFYMQLDSYLLDKFELDNAINEYLKENIKHK